MTDQTKPQAMDPAQQRQFLAIPVGDSQPGAEEVGGTYTPEGEPVPEQPALSGEMIMGPLIGLIFGMLADRRGDHWKLTETEQQELARTGGAVMDHYMPVTTGPLGTFLLCASVAVGPRVMVERELIKERAEKDKKRYSVSEKGGGTDGD